MGLRASLGWYGEEKISCHHHNSNPGPYREAYLFIQVEVKNVIGGGQ
jgi:hypothetical protein